MRKPAMTALAGFVFAFSFWLGLAVPMTGRAQTVNDSDRATFRAMIARQIDAFQRDDGAAAYDFASPTIRELFPTVERFMTMVRNGYPPVYRPRSVTFGAVVDSPAGPLQKVFLTGPAGRHWVAIYTMQRQPDGSWKINGCTLVEDDSPMI